ncbi:quinone-dependent dihydroorotate dehydrogenase [Halosimplex halobium]|uniref:quinone-dependent dihydroorotate dehydrogenase n=1 Tax=Halosimplex halobium TaxID=3396618 RepID=UPI003F568866
MNAYDIAKPLLFSLPAETAHTLGHGVVSAAGTAPLDRAIARHYAVDDPRLRVDALESSFPNPVGVAAGFDKNAEAVRGLAALGFGFVEVGGVTAVPQSGNARPRMFRLRADDAVINRMGLNNDGAATVGERLRALDAPVPVGVNIAKSEHVDTAGAPADYLATYEEVAAGGDFFVVNVSCPNSQGFEELQNREAMTAILTELQDAGAAPLLIKLSPDLPEPAVADTLDLVTELGLNGVVATNTSTERPDTLESPNRAETGGLSGAPIEARATEMTRFVAERVDVPVVGVGGVATAEDAYRKIRAGASLVQLYTAFLYRGPSIAREINLGLLDLLERDGFDSVTEAVGADLD